MYTSDDPVLGHYMTEGSDNLPKLNNPRNLCQTSKDRLLAILLTMFQQVTVSSSQQSQPQGKSTLSFCVHTYSYNVGRLVRVALVAVVCDKPAAHKIGGFASHSHTYYCTDCWICISSKGDVSAFQHRGIV